MLNFVMSRIYEVNNANETSILRSTANTNKTLTPACRHMVCRKYLAILVVVLVESIQIVTVGVVLRSRFAQRFG